jgi:F-type H+-transporting ATPase subunit gamma
LKSIKNIAKITKSMKMIASTKLARAQRAMNSARAYGETSSGVLRSFFILALSDLLCYSNYF